MTDPDPWTCRCGRGFAVPSLARDCEARCHPCPRCARPTPGPCGCFEDAHDQTSKTDPKETP